MLARPALLRAALALALGGSACGKEIKQSYTIDIVGMEGDVFSEADHAILLLNGREVSRATVRPKAGFQLQMPNLDPNVTGHAVFAVRAERADGSLFAYGQTPEVEVMLMTASLRVFVQPPGTLKHGRDTDTPFSSHVAVAAAAAPEPPLTLPMTVPLFGLGATRMAQSSSGMGTIEIDNSLVYLYSPLSHLSAPLFSALPRAQAAAITRADGKVFLFGGTVEAANGIATHPVGQLDVFSVVRFDLASFDLTPVSSQEIGPAARSSTELVPFDNTVFAFGGLDAAGKPLASILKIDPDSNSANPIACDGCARPFTAAMAAARVGHTATLINSPGQKREALIFGGTAAGAPAAEVVTLDAEKPVSRPVDAPVGAARHGHAALLLKNDATSQASRVLIVGGNDGTRALDDGLIYDASKNGGLGALQANALKLQTAREDFSAFVVGNDLVVYGGRGPAGELLDSGEIFDLDTLAAAGTFQGMQPRAGAAAVVLSNQSVIVCGGLIPNVMMPGTTIQSNLVEIYQPRRM
jgi:hypothetical protein